MSLYGQLSQCAFYRDFVSAVHTKTLTESDVSPEIIRLSSLHVIGTPRDAFLLHAIKNCFIVRDLTDLFQLLQFHSICTRRIIWPSAFTDFCSIHNIKLDDQIMVLLIRDIDEDMKQSKAVRAQVYRRMCKDTPYFRDSLSVFCSQKPFVFKSLTVCTLHAILEDVRVIHRQVIKHNLGNRFWSQVV